MPNPAYFVFRMYYRQPVNRRLIQYLLSFYLADEETTRFHGY